MALASILRTSASSFAPLGLALRALWSNRNYHSAIFTAPGHSSFPAENPSPSPFPQSHRYSTKSDESLLRVIEPEIQCAEETDDHERVEDIPSGFPFEIEDEPGYQTITLKRESRVKVRT